MKERQLRLGILPTAGTTWSQDCGWLPTTHGLLRINEIVNALKLGKISAIAIIGGSRLGGTPSEADVYTNYIRKHWEEVAVSIVIVDAKETCTNRDIPAAAKLIDIYFASYGIHFRQEAPIWVTSYKEHLDRIEFTLKNLRFSDIERQESGEESCYFGSYPNVSAAIEWVLTSITKIDPEWRWLGCPLVWLANKRLYETSRE
ncbi:MAG: hypothetical protein M1324_04315 [Patescibacteria group bacterium]|nr:hypothetical protein [Patescibacteria group bacterium]